MNSLAYLSRQFDVLASAKTPPPSPTTEHPQNRDGSRLQRVSTWSTKSFLFPPSASSSGKNPKRSRSSPTFASLRKSSSLVPANSSPDLETQARSESHIENVVRRIFFIRLIALVWDNLRAVWISLYRRESLEGQPASSSIELKVREGSKVEIYPCVTQEISQERPPPLLPSVEHHLAPSHVPAPHSTTLLLRSSESSTSTSRSPTPVLGARKTPFHLPKTLVLDLDETLIHSTSRPLNTSASGGSGFFGLGSFSGRNKGTSHMVEVVLGGRSTLYHVYKRPFVDFFLRTVSGWYTLVIFTASMQEYADPVIDWLDAGRGILAHRLFRDSCTQLPNGSFTKDLSLVEGDLSRVCLIDNSPISYRVNEANGIPIEGWTHDPHDEALLDLLPVLDSLRFTSDVRRVLGLRTAGAHS